MPIASRSVPSSSLWVTMTTAIAGSMARISPSSSRPRRPGICSSSSTTLYGWRRNNASASSPWTADATVNPCASRNRRWAASPSTSSSTQRMLFGRGIEPKLTTTGEAGQREGKFARVLCVLLVRFSSIGDILLTTPLVRALARRHPEAKLVYVTKRAMAPLVADNPHLAEVVALEPDEPIRHLARRLSALAPTLLIATKLDAYRVRVPVAERYFEAAARLDTHPDGAPPEFCLGRGATERVAQ